MLYKFITAVAVLATSAVAAAPFNETTFFENLGKRDFVLKPVMNGQNFPDPAVIRVGNDFYGYATNGKVNGKTVHIQLARSLNNFESWTFMGQQDGMPTLPDWVDPTNPRVWAPDVVQLASGSFVMYYTAALKSKPNIHCLGVAFSGSMLGPFTHVDKKNPWVCPQAQGGAIDPSGYYNAADNTRWVVYKVDGNAVGHGGSCNNGVKPIVSTPIMLQQVSNKDGFVKIGIPIGPLITNGPADGPVVEAPSLTKMDDGTYVLFFSSNCFATPLYDVSYATAKNIKGPYTKYGPLLVTGNMGLTAPGGLDIAINGFRAVFHGNYNGGRAMYTALIGGGGNRYQAYVKNT